MTAIGPLVFCTDCGDLLPPSMASKKNILICECCGRENNDITSRVVVTESKDTDFPSPLRLELSEIQAIDKSKIQVEQVDPNMDCPKCGQSGIRYSEVQLRSADEGTTIIYSCDCGNRWNQEN